MPREINMGDIGYLDEFGEFHAILNIFHPYVGLNGDRFEKICMTRTQEGMTNGFSFQKHHLFTSNNIISRIEDQRNEWVVLSLM